MRARVLIVVVFLALFSAYARKREHYGEGFSIDLPQPYDQLLATVRDVVNDGTIRGTFQYKGTSELEGTQSAQTSDALSPLDRTRHGALQTAPAHASGTGTTIISWRFHRDPGDGVDILG